MINGISAAELGSFVEYLKEENQTAKSSNLTTLSLDDYLNEPDAASVIEIEDETIKAAGEDNVRAKASQYATIGINSAKIDKVFGEKKDEKEDASNNGGCCGAASCGSSEVSSLRTQNAEARSMDAQIIAQATKIGKENVKKEEALNAKIKNAQVQHDTLKDQYTKLNDDVTAKQKAKEEANQADTIEYQKKSSQMDVVAATKTDKYQAIEEEEQDVQKQNFFADGFKVNSDNHFTALNANINAADNNHWDSTGYILAGDNMVDIGSDVTKTNERVNSSAISIVEEAISMQNSTCPQQQEKGNNLYARGMNLVNESFDNIRGGQDVIEGSNKFYSQATKLVSSGNRHINGSSSALTNITNNNNDISNKILELQSQEAEIQK